MYLWWTPTTQGPFWGLFLLDFPSRESLTPRFPRGPWGLPCFVNPDFYRGTWEWISTMTYMVFIPVGHSGPVLGVSIHCFMVFISVCHSSPVQGETMHWFVLITQFGLWGWALNFYPGYHPGLTWLVWRPTTQAPFWVFFNSIFHLRWGVWSGNWLPKSHSGGLLTRFSFRGTACWTTNSFRRRPVFWSETEKHGRRWVLFTSSEIPIVAMEIYHIWSR